MKKSFLVICFIFSFLIPSFSNSNINYKIETPVYDSDNNEFILVREIWDNNGVNIIDRIVMKKPVNFDVYDDEVAFLYLDNNQILIVESRPHKNKVHLSIYNKSSDSIKELYTIESRYHVVLAAFYNGFLYTLEILPGHGSNPYVIRKRTLDSNLILEEITLEKEPGLFLHRNKMSFVNDEIVAISCGSIDPQNKDMEPDRKVWFYSLKDGHIIDSINGFFFNKGENELYYATDNNLKQIVEINGQKTSKIVGTIKKRNCRIKNIKNLGDKILIAVEKKKLNLFGHFFFGMTYEYETKAYLCSFEKGSFVIETECPFYDFGMEIR